MEVPPHSRKLFKVFDDVMEQVCLGNMTAKDALEEAEKRWNEILVE